MNLWRKIGLLAILAVAFAATQVGTSSATVLCKIKIPECPSNALPVPEIVPSNLATGTEAVFTQALGASCKVSSLELKTTEDLGFWPEPLLAEVIEWKFSSCSGSCTTVTALKPRQARFDALREGSPPTVWNGNGSLKITSAEIKLSGCTGGVACTDTGTISLKVVGGLQMKLIASLVPMSVSGGTSCMPGANTAKLSAEYLVSVPKTEGLWLEPVP
jgi:hypothetical protein